MIKPTDKVFCYELDCLEYENLKLDNCIFIHWWCPKHRDLGEWD